MQPAMDPIRRMFAELAEANGAVRVRFHSEGAEDHTERTMTYREYHSWLATLPSSGLKLEWVEQVEKPQ